MHSELHTDDFESALGDAIDSKRRSEVVGQTVACDCEYVIGGSEVTEPTGATPLSGHVDHESTHHLKDHAFDVGKKNEEVVRGRGGLRLAIEVI